MHLDGTNPLFLPPACLHDLPLRKLHFGALCYRRPGSDHFSSPTPSGWRQLRSVRQNARGPSIPTLLFAAVRTFLALSFVRSEQIQIYIPCPRGASRQMDMPHGRSCIQPFYPLSLEPPGMQQTHIVWYLCSELSKPALGRGHNPRCWSSSAQLVALLAPQPVGRPPEPSGIDSEDAVGEMKFPLALQISI